MTKQKDTKAELNKKKILETCVGNVEYVENDIVIFPEGIYGYEEYKKYIIFQPEAYVPFSWLLSIDPPGLMFPIIDPTVVVPNYKPKINGGQTIGDVLMVIVTIGGEGGKVTLNLKAPILIDSNKREGKQVILTDSSFPLRYEVNQS